MNDQQTAPLLKSVQFRREREAGWRAMEALIERIRANGLASLTPEELEEAPLIYRSVTSSLSVARAIVLDQALVAYLDDLALRAFLTIHTPPLDISAAAARFFRLGFPRAVRTMGWHIAIAFGVFLVGALSGFVLAHGNEAYWFNAFVPGDLANGRGPSSTTQELRHALEMGVSQNVFDAIGNALFSHNTTVALMIFGLGFLAGMPTIVLTLFQGLILGVFIELYYRHGLTVQFLGWVSIHGVTEILAFTLFAAAGLRIAELAIFPGRYSRVDTLASQGPLIAKVAVGAGAMLFVAAILEGYFRQAIQSTTLRFTVAGLSALFWCLYLTLSGSKSRQ